MVSRLSISASLIGTRIRVRASSPSHPSGGNHGFGSSHTTKIGAVRSGIIAGRACLSGEEQAIVHRCGELGAAIRLPGQRVRIGAAREWIGAPAVKPERLHPSGEIVAEQGDEFANGKINESNVAACFEFERQAAADYIAALSAELARIAHRHGLNTAAGMLEMASVEAANAISRPTNGSRRPSDQLVS